MHGLDRRQLVGALIALATALFLLGMTPEFRWRAAARRLAVAVYAAVFAGVAVWAALWLAGMKL